MNNEQVGGGGLLPLTNHQAKFRTSEGRVLILDLIASFTLTTIQNIAAEIRNWPPKASFSLSLSSASIAKRVKYTLSEKDLKTVKEENEWNNL